jgi:hypothetical protein
MLCDSTEVGYIKICIRRGVEEKRKCSFITVAVKCTTCFQNGSVLHVINVPSVKDGFSFNRKVRKVCRN